MAAAITANGDDSDSESSTSDRSKSKSDMDHFLSLLDIVGSRVQDLRKRAMDLKGEKDNVLQILSCIKNDSLKSFISLEEFEELESVIGMLKGKCENIDIDVKTSRNDQQEKALKQVNSMIEKLEHLCVNGDSSDISYQEKARTYLNACVSDTSASGSIDYKFQAMVLDCVVEDQKSVRQRLETLVEGRCHVDFFDKQQTESPGGE